MRKNYTYFAALVIVILFVSTIYMSNNRQDISEAQPVSSPDSTVTEWATYSDSANGFQIDYPANLKAFPQQLANEPSRLFGDADIVGGGVNFAPSEDGPGIISVRIYRDAHFTNIDEWFRHENEERERLREERRIIIANNDAIVTYYISVTPEFTEEFPYEKKTAFIHDGDLYVIWTRFLRDSSDYDHIWNSFTLID